VVAVAAVAATISAGLLTVRGDQHRDMVRQQEQQTTVAAHTAATAYVDRHNGWSAALPPAMAAVSRTGAAAQVLDARGKVVWSSADFAIFPAHPERTAPVVAAGRTVGSVRVRFVESSSKAIFARFNGQRVRARIISIVIGVLFGLLVALIVVPRITAPLSKLLRVAQAMAAGKRDARVGRVRGFRDVRELAGTFDHMADTLSRQDQVRRNLVADVAHQLRTPISILQASSEAMMDGLSRPTRANIASLHEETRRLSRMVDDLQELSAAEAAAVQLTLRPADLSLAAASAADSLSEIYDQADVSLVRRLTPAVAPCDDSRMYEVITNLLSNAVKFTPAGGRVELETRPNGKSAVLSVRDTGIGIAADELPHISERFFRGANSAQQSGSGIGLAIVDELVRGHHGTLDITSEKGKGTRVTINLPAA